MAKYRVYFKDDSGWSVIGKCVVSVILDSRALAIEIAQSHHPDWAEKTGGIFAELVSDDTKADIEALS